MGAEQSSTGHRGNVDEDKSAQLAREFAALQSPWQPTTATFKELKEVWSELLQHIDVEAYSASETRRRRTNNAQSALALTERHESKEPHGELIAIQELARSQQQVFELRIEVESLRRELAAAKAQPPVVPHSFNSVPQPQQLSTLDGIKATRRAELEAQEEFAFGGRAVGLPSRLRTAGYSCIEAKAAGYTFADALAAGYSLAEAVGAGYEEAQDARTSSITIRNAKSGLDQGSHEYTPFELTVDRQVEEQRDEDGEDGDMPSAGELVSRWQHEIVELRGRSLSEQQTQSLSVLAEMLTGDVDNSEQSEEIGIGESL